jgi:hypothetical protein
MRAQFGCWKNFFRKVTEELIYLHAQKIELQMSFIVEWDVRMCMNLEGCSIKQS